MEELCPACEGQGCDLCHNAGIISQDEYSKIICQLNDQVDAKLE